jgi:hypothetical protein
MNENENPWKDFEVGFVRKNDGKIVNVKLYDVFKQFCHADFINNEVHINGETLIADSFRKPYYEVKLSIQKNCINSGNGAYQLNGNTYDTDQRFVMEKDSIVQSTLLPDQNSLVKGVRDENQNQVQHENNIVNLRMDNDHVITIDFVSNQQQ